MTGANQHIVDRNQKKELSLICLSSTKQLEKETIEAEIHDVFPDKWWITAAAWNLKSSKPLSRNELKSIVTLAWSKDNVPEDEIARELRCSERYVRDLLKDARAALKKEQQEKVKKFHEMGFSQRKIARKTGLSKSRIDQLSKPASKLKKDPDIDMTCCPVFELKTKTGPREIPVNNSKTLVQSSATPSTGGNKYLP